MELEGHTGRCGKEREPGQEILDGRRARHRRHAGHADRRGRVQFFLVLRLCP
jgi:hypothetical protein